MTDFFALFGQPRQPWLDPNVLKEKHHELTRRAHPDIRGHEISESFEEINEGYRILSEPKLRIQYLLQLEGEKSSTSNQPVPSDLQEIFLQIGTLCQKTQRVLAQIGDNSGALARSLAKSELLPLQRQTEQLLEQLSHSYDACLAELRNLNQIWSNKQGEASHQLHRLRDRMAYLSRWIAQLREMELQFTLRG